ncbi:MAG: agmatinase, partial [Actinomycetota bacterium]
MEVGRPGEPSYAGGGTFSKIPLVLDPADLVGVDVAIVGAPVDEAVSHRPGARFGPRAIRLADPNATRPPRAWNMDLGLDPFEVLRVVDHGDAPVVPADRERNHAAIRATVADVVRAGAIPIVLGGDHSIAHPDVGAVADVRRPDRVGLIHFDAHADDADEIYGVKHSHGTPLRRLVEEGSLRGSDIVQVGLRGYWPGPEEFAWARAQGFRWYRMDEIQDRGIDDVVDAVLADVADLPHVFLSVDIDVCDPAAAPGTGVPEPGGLDQRDLLRAVRRIAATVPLAGMEVVEVAPPFDHAEVTALLAHRVGLEALSAAAPEREAGQGLEADPGREQGRPGGGVVGRRHRDDRPPGERDGGG